MKWIVPDIYPEFKCIADRCRHSCCIGWEIDVDPDSVDYYYSIRNQFGEKLREKIRIGEEDSASFILDERERCPFLCENGLCEMILNLGEDSLCQICRDHPRFFTDYTDRTEIGLGLCCEEACRLMLTHREPMNLIEIDNDEYREETNRRENCFFEEREKLFRILQNRNQTLEKRTREMAGQYNIYCDTDNRTLIDAMLDLEILDDCWRQLLLAYKNNDTGSDRPIPAEWELPREQFLFYLLYRHLPDTLKGYELKTLLHWILVMERFVADLCLTVRGCGPEGYMDTVRMFSAEIEYSDENTDRLLEYLHGNC